MSIPFSETINNTGGVQQVRDMLRVDAIQWPTARIVNSYNNWLDTVAGYAIGADKRFQWDDTNHTKLPEGTTALTINQTDYSFLADEQGNNIITLTGISILVGTVYVPLVETDRNSPDYDAESYGVTTGTPTAYDKIADNIIRLDFEPSATVALGLKFFFQRTPSYFVATDTTKAPGVSPLLHRGFVIAAVYDALLAGIGSADLQAISVERDREMQKMVNSFTIRNNDTKKVMTHKRILHI